MFRFICLSYPYSRLTLYSCFSSLLALGQPEEAVYIYLDIGCSEFTGCYCEVNAHIPVIVVCAHTNINISLKRPTENRRSYFPIGMSRNGLCFAFRSVSDIFLSQMYMKVSTCKFLVGFVRNQYPKQRKSCWKINVGFELQHSSTVLFFHIVSP